MKVIFITREGYQLPGARIRCYNFSREISRDGIETQILSFSDTLGAKDGAKESLMSLGEKLKYNWKAFEELIKDKDAIFYLQRFNYHVLAPFFARIFNRNRIILDLDDWEMREEPKYYFNLYPSSKAHYFTRKIAKESIFCVAASRFLENFLRQFNQKVYYIPSGVDTELFFPRKVAKLNQKITFAWVGTFHKREYIENIAFALDCFKILRERYADIFFEITGEGIYKNDLAAIVSGCNDDHIILRQWMDPGAIPDYLGNVDIGIFPIVKASKFNLAKSPTKLFEYMAMEKPTVSSNIGEMPHIISDGENGLLAKTKEEFLVKMQELIEDENLRFRIGKNARRAIEERYSLKILGSQLHKILSLI